MTAVAAPGPAAEPAAEPDFDRLAMQVDEALAAIARLDPEPRAAAEALKSALDGLHRAALVTMVRTMRADEAGKRLLFDLVDDPAVRAVFAIHGIIKADPMTRALAALEGVRPYLRSHGGDVELVRIEDGVAFVRLHGSCNGCSMSAVTLRDGVADALVAGVAEVSRVEVLTDQPSAAFIPLAAVGRRDAGWVRGIDVAEVPPGTMVRFDLGEDSFVVTNVANAVAVFRNECVHQGMSLDGGLLDDGVLVCPWHGFRFEATSGECLSAPGAQLQQVPTRVDDGVVWVRVRAG